MSAKGKKHKKADLWSVSTSDGHYVVVTAVRLKVRGDGGHVFSDRKGIVQSFGPGVVRHAERLLPGPRVPILPVPVDEPAPDVPAREGLKLPARDRL